MSLVPFSIIDNKDLSMEVHAGQLYRVYWDDDCVDCTKEKSCNAQITVLLDSMSKDDLSE